MFKLDKLFRTAVQYKASDLYYSTGIKPVLRINGKLISIKDHEIVTPQMADEHIMDMLNEQQKQNFATDKELDFSINVEGLARFRVNVFWQRKGLSASFRMITEVVPTMEELGLPQQLKGLTAKQNGLILITGPTGSGKTSTLAALLQEINLHQVKHIITIEDPIEYIFENQESIIEQREIGTHTNSFAQALRASLREDPDVIMIGEMRDLETISLAITAAETGHLVLATLHTSGAAKAVDRMIDVFPANQQPQIRLQLAENLRAVVWQNLIPTKDKQGRVGAYEVLMVNNAIQNMIRKEKTHQINSAMEIGMKEGMQTMQKALQDLLANGLISQEQANLYTPKEYDFED